MASSDADQVLCSTPGRANFQRISRLLVCGGTSLLREIFDSIHAPSALPTVLGDPAREKQLKGARLTPPQWNCLKPSPGVYGKSIDFDITLLSSLLRTICNLTPPPTGWDSLPATFDHSLAADLVRIKLYRNSVYGHVKESMEVTDDEFSALWQDISETIVRIAGNISPAKRNKWKKAIDGFLNAPLTPEDERNVRKLRMWYFYDMDLKKAMEQVEVSCEEIKSQFETAIRNLTAQVKLLIDCKIISPAKNIRRQPFPTTQQVLNLIAQKYLEERPLDGFEEYMERAHKVLVLKIEQGSLLITVQCSSLEILEGLWQDYTSGHLNKVAQELLVTPEILAELRLTSVKLKVTILKEEYEAGKQYFLQSEISNLSAEMRVIENELSVTREEKSNILEELNNTKRQMKADRKAAGKETKRLEETAQKKDETIRDLKEKYESLEHKCKDIERQLIEKETEMAAVKQKLETIKKEKGDLEKELSVEREENSKLSKEYKELENKFQQTHHEPGSAPRQLQSSMRGATRPSVEEMAAVIKKLETIMKEKGDLKKELSVERENNRQLSKEYKELENKYEQLQHERGSAISRSPNPDFTRLLMHGETRPSVEEMGATSRPTSAQIWEQLRREKREIEEGSDEMNKLISSAVKGRSIPKARVFIYRSDFDEKGVIYALGTNFGSKRHWVNPASSGVPNPITVTRSSGCLGEAKDLLSSYGHGHIKTSSTEDKEMSWWCVDLSEKYSLFLTHYTLRHGRNNPESCLRSWNLEGSHDGKSWPTEWETEAVLDAQRDHKWYTDREFAFMTQTWPIEGKREGQEAYRFFRIVQTDKNSSGRFDIYLSGMELYGVLLDMSHVSN